MQIPTEWLEVLRKVQRVFPQAFIAGGALRDLEYNRPVKDVDIFIPVPRTEGSIEEQEVAFLSNISKLDDMFDHLVSPTIPVYFKNVTEDILKGGRLVESVHNVRIDDVHYEMILAPEETCDIRTFDFSICQIKFDGDTVERTEAYQQTLADGVVLFNHDYRTPNRAKERIERMQNKFPDLEIRV